MEKPTLAKSDQGQIFEQEAPKTRWNSVRENMQVARSRLAALPWKAILLGQILSLCITSTNVLTTELAALGVSAPTAQSTLHYFLLGTVYLSIWFYQNGIRAIRGIPATELLHYAFLGLVDMEASYFIVKAYQHTNILSAMMLSSWATPVCIILSIFILKARYSWTQYLSVLVCLVGLGLLIYSDTLAGRYNSEANNVILGDIFCIVSAILYGVSNVIEERCLRRASSTQVLGFMGLFGSIVAGIQLAILEREEVSYIFSTEPSFKFIGSFLGFNFVLFAFYSIIPWLYRLASATFGNLSLLTANFYGLLIGLLVYRYTANYVYFIAYIIIISGIVLYNYRFGFMERNEHVFGSNPDPEKGLQSTTTDTTGTTDTSSSTLTLQPSPMTSV